MRANTGWIASHVSSPVVELLVVDSLHVHDGNLCSRLIRLVSTRLDELEPDLRRPR